MHSAPAAAPSTGGKFPHIPAGEGQAFDIIGELVTLKAISAETGGAFTVMELTSPPQGGPPLHTHPSAETFTILEGEFEFSGIDQGALYAIRATPGDTVFIPGGAPHTYKTVSATPGKTLCVFVPGVEMERFFAEAGTPVTDPSTPPVAAGPPDEAQIAQVIAVAKKHDIEFVAPPPAP